MKFLKDKMVQAYILGLTYSLLLTFTAYALATNSDGSLQTLLILGALALAQLAAQLFYFLHIGEEDRPRVKLLSFGFMSLILFIIVAGSIWIMHHLDYNMMQMHSDEKEEYMLKQKDKGF